MQQSNGLPGFPAQPQSVAAPQGQGLVAPAQYQAQPQQQFAAPAGPWDPNLGSAIAGATIGIQRLPQVPAGNHVLKVIKTLAPERSRAMVAEFEVVESDTCKPGEQYSWYQDLSGGNPQKSSAQQSAVLTMILRTCGFADKDAAAAAGCTQEQIASTINACAVEPGPLVGRLVRCSGIDTGRTSQAGNAIVNHNFTVAG